MIPPLSFRHMLPPWRIAVAVLLLAWSALAEAAPAEAPDSLTRLGSQAIESFDRQLDPLPVRITMDDWSDREAGVIERAQMRRVYVAAVKALIAQAAGAGAGSDLVFDVRNALDELARHGRSVMPDKLFAAQAEAAQARGEAGRAEAALAWRHSVALSELPVAMATRGGRFDSRTVVRGRTQSPLGALALPGLERSAQLDGSDPWAWIMLAWLGWHDAALPAALQTAMASADDDAALAASQQLASLLARQGRSREAAQIYITALRRTEQATMRRPKRDADVQNLAYILHRSAEFENRLGLKPAAWKTMQQVLRLREGLASAEPGDIQRQWDLIATHSAMAKLPHDGGESNHLSRALALDSALNARNRFVPMLDGNSWAGLSGMMFTLAGVLALVIGLGLLSLYRLRIGRWMRAAAAASNLQAPTQSAVTAVSFDRREAPALCPLAGDLTNHRPRSAALVSAASASRRAGVVNVFAGLAFAMTASLLYFRFGNVIFRPWTFAIQVWSWSMPMVVVLCLLWTGDRRRQASTVAAYVAVVVVFCVRVALSDTPPLSVDAGTFLPMPATLLLMALIGPQKWQSPMLLLPGWGQVLFMFWSKAHQLAPALLFLSRYIRAIGPVIVALFIVLCAGGGLSTIAFSSFAGIQLQSRLTEAGLPMMALMPAKFLAGALLALPLAWLVGRGLAAMHRGKWFNDQIMVFDAIWMFQTLFLVSALTNAAGVGGLAGFAAFGAYKAIAVLGMRRAASAARARPPARLLLLRVFGHRQRSERLLDVLAARWRYAGPIQMIGAPDVATRTIDPNEFMDFLSGRLRRQFVIDPQDLPRRIAEIDMLPDADGRFRINDVYCGNDTWHAAVRALMSTSDLCLMDLRGFSEGNSGCVIELQALLELVPANAIVLLVDRSTDQPFLESTLRKCHASLLPGSVNANAATQLATLNASGSELHAVRRLLLAADALLAQAPPATRSSDVPAHLPTG